MSNLTLSPTPIWHSNINQVDVTEPIVGGDGGNANLAARQLAENLLWLRQKLSAVEAIKVGDIYFTTLNHVDPIAVTTHMGYGSWKRYAEGRTLVGYSQKESDPASYKTIGNEFGANTHKLTVDQIPIHQHDMITGGADATRPNAVGGALHSTGAGNSRVSGVSGKAGGDEAHNNIQPSIVAAYWVRTS